MDESEGPAGVFVLAGHIASIEAWAKFSEEWKEMLPYGTLNTDGSYHFKMTEMAANDERLARTPAFFRIIEKHVILSLSCVIKREDVRNAKERLWIPGVRIDWDFINNLYKLAFRCLLDSFHTHKSIINDFVPIHQKVDFIFDDRVEKKTIVETWNQYMEERPPETVNLYGAVPRFEKDGSFLPLQAADFWAWWIREWYETKENPGLHIAECDFGKWRGIRKYPKLAIYFDEDALFENFEKLARPLIEPGRKIYDVRSANWFEPPWPLGTILGDMSPIYRHGLS